jgi:hypothetical protein
MTEVIGDSKKQEDGSEEAWNWPHKAWQPSNFVGTNVSGAAEWRTTSGGPSVKCMHGALSWMEGIFDMCHLVNWEVECMSAQYAV